jgi:hypothetical protein
MDLARTRVDLMVIEDFEQRRGAGHVKYVAITD